jgi:hypothetical protein
MAQSEPGTLKRRQRSLARALRPGVVPLHKLIPAGFIPEPARRAFDELHLNPKNEADWKVLAALLAIHVFDSGKSPGARPWSTIQQAELLAEVHTRRRDSAAPLNDEQVCRMIARDKKSPPHFRRSPKSVESKGLGLVKQLRKARQQFAANADVRARFPLAFVTGRF